MPLTRIVSRGITDGTITSADLASGVGGKVLQVVNATDSTQRSTNSTTFVTASNTMSVSITPSSASNKVYVIASGNIYINVGGVYAQATIFRDATNLGGSAGMTNNYSGTQDQGAPLCVSVLDSPNTTSAITYQLYFKSSNASGTADLNQNSNCQGSITAFEIAG